MRIIRLACIAVILLSFVSLFAQQQDASLKQANELLKGKKYTEAIEAYKDILKKDDENSMAWFYLASAEYSTKKYYESIESYLRATEGLKGPVVCYNLAGVYALTGQKEKAYTWLERSIERGFSQYSTMQKDGDFESISGEKRFTDLLKEVELKAKPCLSRKEYSQFNFWVGKWDVINPAGNHAGDSEIDLMNNGCTIVENWYGASGFVGKSFNYFDTTDNKWHQFWINQNAQKILFEGKLVGKDMAFYSYDHVKDKKNPYLRRLTFFNLGSDKVRQFSEKSTDEGKSWNTEYDFTYNRKTSSK